MTKQDLLSGECSCKDCKYRKKLDSTKFKCVDCKEIKKGKTFYENNHHGPLCNDCDGQYHGVD